MIYRLLIGVFVSGISLSPAVDISVTNLDDAGPGSLRQAISQAGDDDRVVFISSLDQETLFLTSGQIVIETAVEIAGVGLTSGINIHGANASRIFDVREGGELTLGGNLILTGGSAERGGAILNAGQLTMSGITLSSNTARNQGGGIYNTMEGQLEMTDVTMESNSALSNGGAVFNAGTATLTTSSISMNEATTSGGGIYNTGMATISNVTCTSNVALNSGGGIFNTGTLTATGGSVNSNTATVSGAGLYNSGEVTWTGGSISTNESEGAGAGILNTMTLTLSSVTVASNEAAQQGGGIFNSGNLTVRLSTIESNASGSHGGGIFHIGSQDIETTTFESNTAVEDGGGMYVDGQTRLSRSLFVGNRADENGGGLYVDHRLTVDHCTFTTNNGVERGGAIRTVKQLDLIHCTLSGNMSSAGAAVSASNENPHLYNCIAASGNFDGRLPNDSPRNSIQEAEPALQALAIYNGGPTRTMPPAEGSSAIDAGAQRSGFDIDQDGQPRLSGEAVDLGAVEIQVIPEDPGDPDDPDDPDNPDPDPIVATFNEDSDGDGMNDGLENALGRDPNNADSFSSKNVFVNSVNGQPRLQFGYNPASSERTRLEIRGSLDLLNFDTLVMSSDSPSFGNFVSEEAFSMPVTIPAGGKMFFQLRATLKPDLGDQ